LLDNLSVLWRGSRAPDAEQDIGPDMAEMSIRVLEPGAGVAMSQDLELTVLTVGMWQMVPGLYLHKGASRTMYNRRRAPGDGTEDT